MLRKHNKATCLAISGMDPSGGAGLLADIRSFAAFGVHGLGLVSAETVQNTSRVESVQPRPLRAFTQQLVCLLEEFSPAVTKIGLAGSAGQLRLIHSMSRQGRLGQLVVDPVLVASRGMALTSQQMPRHLLELMSAIDVLTPNLPELAHLTGMAVDTSARALAAARRLLDLGAGAVLVKGGHSRSNTVTDRLVTASSVESFDHPRLKLGKTHGTGCHLSSALTALLAQDVPLPEACAQAIAWTTHTLELGFDAGPLAVRYLDDSISPSRKKREPR